MDIQQRHKDTEMGTVLDIDIGMDMYIYGHRNDINMDMNMIMNTFLS
jgi:hypothetical protein